MADVIINVPNSEVQRQLLIAHNSSVENENLILEEGVDYVFRFAPKIMKENDDMNNLYGVHKDEIQEIHNEIDSIINNTFISSLDLKGVQKWEKLFGLESNVYLDLNVRKELVLTKRRFKPPFTRQNLQKTLESVWGNGNFTFIINREQFEVIIDIHTNSPEVYLKFQKYIRNLIPANMYVIFSIQYTYLYLYRNLTYNNMSALTYGQLSQYA